MTFPSRAFGAGSERRSFDFLRTVDGTNGVVKSLKEAIVAAYEAQDATASQTTPAA